MINSISYEKGIARCLPAQKFNTQPFLSNWSLIGSQKRNSFEYLRWRLREHICKSLSLPCQLLCHVFGWSVAARCCVLGRTREEQTFGASKSKSVSFHNLLQEQNLCTTWIVSLQFFFPESLKKISRKYLWSVRPVIHTCKLIQLFPCLTAMKKEDQARH